MRLVRIAAWCGLVLCALVVVASFHPAVRSVYRAFRPSTAYDTVPPDVPRLSEPAVLVFTKTNGFRHFEAIGEGVAALRRIADGRGWSFFHTENGAVFDSAILARFRAVVWHNASGAPLNAAQRAALRQWIETGGGFAGVHAAVDSSHAGWEWYSRNVIGAAFIGHPLEHQSATVRVESGEHPSMRGAGQGWLHFDEWYSFDRSVRGDEGVEILASVDESTYKPRLEFLWVDQDLSMDDHPVIWTREVGGGRAFLSALGHVASAYRDPYLGILEAGIAWAGRLDKLDPE